MGKVRAHKIELATAAPALEAHELCMLQSLGPNGAKMLRCPGCHGPWDHQRCATNLAGGNEVPVAWSIMVWALFDITWRRSSFF